MSITFDVVRTFNAPHQTTYNSLIDLDAAYHWMHGLVRMERLDDGPIKVGSEWKETRKMFGKEASEHFKVMELQEPEKIVLRCDGSKGSTGKGEYIFTYTVDSAGDQSQVTLHGEIKGLTGLSKLFGKLMAGSFKKACTKDLDALKQYLENYR
ncbi:SRPBCC family protein [Alkalibacillus salilacus]|uniref:Carbon monoxide dehydrogenase subunit G n=1 Tax=Alkalibacillus salilacus TaxID=284582 RepID=A0ABT9VER0_9BACI|nr:SRPBCC family protein [Alkalibacillus salilacus]MDQ0159463.1 carbon monoxide dehydrogenase subunit G [Alkalibacillus salilacus]